MFIGGEIKLVKFECSLKIRKKSDKIRENGEAFDHFTFQPFKCM